MWKSIKSNFLVFILLLACNSLSAAVPTIEGLLRNPSNSDVVGPNIVLRLKLNTKAEEASTEESTEYFVKYIFNTEYSSKIRLLEVVYSSEEMKDDSILAVKYYQDITSQDLKKEKRLYLSILSSLALNRSNELVGYVKGISKEFKTNKEAVNEEKKSLLDRYKRYLIAKKENEEEELQNPLKPENPEVKQKSKEVMSESFFKTSEKIILDKIDGRFMWSVKLDNFQGIFENESLRMKKISIENLDGKDVYSFDKYILFDGVHEFPKIIKINLAGREFEITTNRLRHIESKAIKITKRYSDYMKKISGEMTPIQHPLI